MAAMLRELKSLARETAVYGLSTILGRLLSFLLAPLFTHLLARAESGVVQTTYSYIAFLTVFYGMGLDVAYLRFGRARRGGDPDAGAFAGAFLSVLSVALVVSGLVFVFAAPVAAAIGLTAAAAPVVRLAAGILALDAACLLPYSELRASHRAVSFATIKLAAIALNLVLAWVFVHGMRLGVRGVFLANLAASACALTLLAPTLLKRLGRPDPARLKKLLAFGLPLVAAGLGSMIVQVADRPLMSRLSGLAMAGVYGNCYKLGVFMMLIVGMFDQAWKPFVLERSDAKDVDRLIARVLTYFVAIAAWAFLVIAHFVGPFARAPLFHGHSLFAPLYWDGLPIVPLVTLGYLFNGAYYVMLAPLLIDKRTSLIAVATWTGAFINVGANLYLIPHRGMMGAAWATCLAYAAMAAVVWALGRGSRKVPYEWRRLALLAAWTLGLWLPGVTVPLALRAVLTLAYPLGLWASGFLHPEELAELKAMFSARAARRAPAPAPAEDPGGPSGE
jgi:O-antigen/teichoic acid export membrane protein